MESRYFNPGMSRPQVEAVLDAVSDAVLVIDRAFSIAFLNHVVESVTGFSREEMVGQRCYSIFRGTLCQTRCPLARALRTGEPAAGEQALTDSDGEQTTVHVRVCPLCDREGHIIGGVATFRPEPALYSAERLAGIVDPKGNTLSLLDASERATIEDVLRRYEWNQAAAADVLGISRTTLWRKIRKFGIPSPG